MTSLGNKKIMSRNIQKYMDLNHVTRNDLCEAIGVKYTTLTDWIKGNTYPRIDWIEKMANYFGIRKSDLVEDHHDDVSKNQDTSSDKVEWYTDPETAKLAQELHDNPDLRVLLDASRDLPPEKLRALIALITPHIGEDG